MFSTQGPIVSSTKWSLWSAGKRSTVLLTEGIINNDRAVMSLLVDVQITDNEIIAKSKAPGNRRTILIGQGIHDALFAKSLDYYFSQLKIPIDKTCRLYRSDFEKQQNI